MHSICKYRFSIKPFFLPDVALLVNFVQFICLVNVFWPPAKCHEKMEYHSNTERESLDDSKTRRDPGYSFLGILLNSD